MSDVSRHVVLLSVLKCNLKRQDRFCCVNVHILSLVSLLEMFWLQNLCYFSYLSRASWYFGHSMWKHAEDSDIFPMFMFVSGALHCLLSLQMEIDRGWSFTGTGKALLATRVLRAVTAGVSICKSALIYWVLDGDQVQSRGIVCIQWLLMRDYCKKKQQREAERGIIKVTWQDEAPWKSKLWHPCNDSRPQI